MKSGTFHGVALANLRTGTFTPISRFASPEYQALGAYDGSVAVWKEFHSPDSLDDYTVREWTRSTGRIVTVGQSHKDARTGQTFPSPWTEPTLGEHYAAWVEGTAMDGRGHLVVLNTRSTALRVFSSGHPGGASVVYRGDLVWAESTKPGALTQIFAKNLMTGRAVTPPPALAAQRGVNAIATDGTALAWVGSDQRSILYAADGRERPHLLVRLKIGGFNPPTVVRGPVVMSTYSDGVLVVDDTGTRATVIHGGGAVTGTGAGFVIRQPPSEKSSTFAEGLAQFTPREFRLPPCARN